MDEKSFLGISNEFGLVNQHNLFSRRNYFFLKSIFILGVCEIFIKLNIRYDRS